MPQIYIHFPRTNVAAWAGSLAALLHGGEPGDGAVNIKQLAQGVGMLDPAHLPVLEERYGFPRAEQADMIFDTGT